MSDNILDLLDKEIEQTKMHKINIEQALAECNEQLKRLVKTRVAYTGNKEKPGTTRKNKKASGGGKNPPQGADEVYNIMFRNPDEEFSAPMLTEHVEHSHSSVNKILDHLRSEGKIDLTRKGGPTGVTKFYKVALTERV